jgi:hypothetical protein
MSMSTTMTAQEISQAWLSYVSDTFMLSDGCIRPDVQEEYVKIECNETFARQRDLWRSYTDDLIDKIIQCPPESRPELLESTDYRSLAYVQDRIQCGTELLTALVRKGLQINLDHDSSLPDFFRQVLLQKME